MTHEDIADALRQKVRDRTITGWYQWTYSIRTGPRWTLAHPDRTTTTMDRDTITAWLNA